jgi:hypothetical protein
MYGGVFVPSTEEAAFKEEYGADDGGKMDIDWGRERK